MRVYLSVDMEGVAGVGAAEPTRRGDAGYPAAVELMVGETNAAIEGAFDGGASEVVVNDSHGEMFNLPPAAIDRRARLLVGTKPWSMLEGAAAGDFGIALFVGYHARAGHPRGTLGHTYSPEMTLVTLQGRPVGEYGINALALGAWGIPVGLVSGDDALADEVAEWLPWAERVVVKRAVGQRASESVHPEVARELIREGAAKACRTVADRQGAGRPRALTIEPPITWTAEFRMPGQADHAAMTPGVVRESDRGVRYTTADPLDAVRAFLVTMRLGALVK
jgi:D-amino peptidase